MHEYEKLMVKSCEKLVWIEERYMSLCTSVGVPFSLK
jgi:hypothetical protein